MMNDFNNFHTERFRCGENSTGIGLVLSIVIPMSLGIGNGGEKVKSVHPYKSSVDGMLTHRRKVVTNF